MTSRTKAHLAVLSANLIYGINFSIMKHVTDKLMQPIALNLMRVLGSTLLFWLLFLIKPTSIKIQKKDILRVVFCALTGVVINQIMFVKGVSLTTTIRASLLMLVCPIAVVFIAAVVIKEKITLQKSIGLFLGVLGAVILVSMKENTKFATNPLLGDIFIIINALSYAFYLVWLQPLMKNYNAVNIIRWVFTIALFIMLPMGWSSLQKTDWSIFGVMDYAALVFIIVAVTFCTFLFNIYGVGILGPTVTGAYIYSQPLFAALISIFIIKDTNNLVLKILAAVLIFIGVYLVSLKRSVTKQTK
jgi:drug/metabolite transporter (DMT)-like permease